MSNDGYRPLAFLDAFGAGAPDEELQAIVDDMDDTDRAHTLRILEELKRYYSEWVERHMPTVSYEDRASGFVEAALSGGSDDDLAQLMAEMPIDDLRALSLHLRTLYGMTRGAWLDRATLPRSTTHDDGSNAPGTL